MTKKANKVIGTKGRAAISIDAEVLRKSQEAAAADGRTFSNYVERLLIAALQEAK